MATGNYNGNVICVHKNSEAVMLIHLFGSDIKFVCRPSRIFQFFGRVQ